MSLSFEVTQLTGIYGLYPCAYRTFDVDDLILNTVGSLVGYLIVPLLAFLPSVRPVEPPPDAVRPVGYLRRMFAFFLDTLIAGLVWSGLTGIIRIDLPQMASFFLLCFFLWLTVWAVLTRGHTPGLWLTRLKITTLAGEKPKAWQMIVRYGLLFGMLTGMWVLVILIIGLFSDNATVIPEPLLRPLGAAILMILAGLPLVFVILGLQRDDDRTLHELISGTRLWARLPARRWLPSRQ
jgi:uncharacterized RDD family membrane protein YckC